MDYVRLGATFEHWADYPSYPLEHEFPKEEYLLRIDRARTFMKAAGLDALVVTSHAVGQWFLSSREPHEWHDQCQTRSAWYILTPDSDTLFMTPTAAGEHFNTTRRSTWVTQIRGIVERTDGSRAENWDIAQMPTVFQGLGLAHARLGFELGGCMTLGLSVEDFLRLRELLPQAQLVDGSSVFRRLLSVHTPLEIERTRIACAAGVWIHNQVPDVLRPRLTEREFVHRLARRFAEQFGDGYAYREEGGWDVRNPGTGDSNLYHAVLTDRVFKAGDQVSRGTSGASFRGYPADVDRIWYLGSPPDTVRRWYRIAWECNRAMAAAIKPGAECADVYAAHARIERAHGLPPRVVGRAGHGLRNTGGLSVHPDNHTVLEPGMILSVEPMFGTEHGWYDLEDQYVVTDSGADALHDLAPETLPIIPV